MKFLFFIASIFFYSYCFSQVFPISTWNKPIVNKVDLITSPVTSVSVFDAISGGTISGTIGDAIISKGVCWSTYPNPTIYNQKSNEGSGNGNFYSSLSTLKGLTTYYLRSYLTTNRGTIYGNELSFITKGAIGDAVLGGKIAYVLQNGDPGFDPENLHGLIITSTDLTRSKWGCYGTDINTNYTYGSGLSNTISIVTNCSESNIAAKLCYDLSIGGYDDWFLPSIEEWIKIFPNSSLIGMSLNYLDYRNDPPGSLGNNGYWSSTQAQMGGGGGQAANEAKWIAYPSGDPNNTYNKQIEMRVRAVRSF